MTVMLSRTRGVIGLSIIRYHENVSVNQLRVAKKRYDD